MQYLVRRGIGLNSRVLKIADREFPRGAVIDTTEFPDLAAADWKTWERHRLVESMDAKSDERERSARRQAAEMKRARAEYDDTPIPLEDSAPIVDAVSCGECEFVAKTPHGLKVHRGRQHKE